MAYATYDVEVVKEYRSTELVQVRARTDQEAIDKVGAGHGTVVDHGKPELRRRECIDTVYQRIDG